MSRPRRRPPAPRPRRPPPPPPRPDRGHARGRAGTAPSSSHARGRGRGGRRERLRRGAGHHRVALQQVRARPQGRRSFGKRPSTRRAGVQQVSSEKYVIATKYYDDQSKQDLSGPTDREAGERGQGQLPARPVRHVRGHAAIAEEVAIPIMEGEGAAETLQPGYSPTFQQPQPGGQFLPRGHGGDGRRAGFQAEDGGWGDPSPPTRLLLSTVEVADGAKKVTKRAVLTVAAYIKYPDKETNLTAQVTQAKALQPGPCCSTAGASPRRWPSSRAPRNWG